MTVGHCLDQNPRAERHVPSGKHPGRRRSQLIIDLENAPWSDLHSVLGIDVREVSLLADGENHAVAGNDLLLVAKRRTEAALLVEDGQTAAHLEASSNAVFTDDFFRAPTVVDLD